MKENEPILIMKGITKRFPGVLALNKVDFRLKHGEIHALVGENGAGKSTLIKILSGVHTPDEGEIILDGKPINFTSPIQAIRAGISVIYQELNLVEDLTVAENIYLGNEGGSWFNLRKKNICRRASELLKKLGFSISATEFVKDLNVSEKQLVEIAKALATNARIIVMDEPTATLTDHETKMLFDHVRNLKKRGVSIIFISHRLEEVFEIADTVTVLRDGQRISSDEISNYTRERLITDVVGRKIENMFPKENKVSDEIIFEVRELNVPGYVHNVSFNVRKGEIFGIAGLVGSGKSGIAMGIYGGLKATAKECKLLGKDYPIPSRPDIALEKGVILVPEDRKSQGLVLVLNILENVVLQNTKFISKLGHLNWKEGKRITNDMVNRLEVKTPSIKQRVSNLSGGNQQKVVLAKGLLRKPKLAIFVEPTRGIDVGAKVEVYKLMNELANQGVGIIMISSELPEVMGMSDRVLVMHRGKQREVFERSEMSQEKIIAAAMGG
ncbi:sugar ABC transporter ATP-binding protein [Kosmotoga olearia]|uniref:ABC transporter related n=1 Tax=Kosmotoga olearia (strain ATCC BAA-1733 / DSM 21960 / TBF 19.5.1) TaxID=521045 RepID=C5CEZ3_KOSOT|nr:sugar ABC transporter ATP-binding protein [Kosmotoga olearia]ACR79322.1 ABC transporter related [Kosmotoga olearia TBF 19.5.1]